MNLILFMEKWGKKFPTTGIARRFWVIQNEKV